MADMQFQFDRNLDYQKTAVDAVVRVFDTAANHALAQDGGALKNQQLGVFGNQLDLDEAALLQNVQAVQQDNDIDVVSEQLGSLDFSVEMETGTGKTYVYLRTMLELNQRYGLTKFIVLVPSVAIREGVMKTIAQTTTHLAEMYGQGIRGFEYNSAKLSRVREFVTSTDMQVMVMTIQSFNKDTNVMRTAPDSFRGEKPIEQIALTRPVIIMDEPQNMGSDLSKAAIQDLDPLCRLRYSATHKEKHNLLYRLGPAEAYEKRLVKKVAVYGIESDQSGEFVFRVQSIETRPVSARVKLECRTATGYELRALTLHGGDYLSEESGNDRYDSGLYVQEIHPDGWVELSNGDRFTLAPTIGEDEKEAIFRLQIRETIKAHLAKQEAVGKQLKVLSLFFIDKVANYASVDGLIRVIFNEEFEKLKKQSEFFKNADVEAVQKAYFAQKSKTEFQDSTTGKSKKDAAAYDLIMKQKERLLSFAEPGCFIFTHSALREGWDNPNVFQICTLNETKSTVRKRQEIGRGLRLPVDVHGERVHDVSTNVLTVIPNESYQEFVEAMQREYQEDGYTKMPKVENARERVDVHFKYKKATLPEDFAALWEKIRQKTTYRLRLKDEDLIALAVAKVNDIHVGNAVVKMSKATLSMRGDGAITAVHEGEAFGDRLATAQTVGNMVQRIADETNLTRQVIMAVLDQAENLHLLKRNAEEYIRAVTTAINQVKLELTLSSGLEYQPSGEHWDLDIFEDQSAYATNTLPVQRSAYSHVMFDSQGERDFAQSLEDSASVLTYVKLPPRFQVATPAGPYNPDWAIVRKTEDGQKLYLMRETKFGDKKKDKAAIMAELRPSELHKIQFGEKHFRAVGVDFAVSVKENLADL